MTNRAWLFLAPALFLVAMNAFIPLMTVVNYSLHNLIPGVREAEYVGLDNYRDVLHVPAEEDPAAAPAAEEELDPEWAAWIAEGEAEMAEVETSKASEFGDAIGRQFLFTFLILAIEIPLGLAVALCLPRSSWGTTASLVLLGIPLLIPWNIVGMVWRVFTRSDIGLLAPVFAIFGYEYQPATSPVDAWWTTVAMDVWHWTPLVVFLCYAGLKTIPEPYFRAAEIDGASRWATFRHVILPRLRYVLILAVLLRTIDSFNIYTEPAILTGGGPGSTTTFMSFFVNNLKDSKGLLAAVSMIYLFIVIMLCYVLFTIMQNLTREKPAL